MSTLFTYLATCSTEAARIYDQWQEKACKKSRERRKNIYRKFYFILLLAFEFLRAKMSQDNHKERSPWESIDFSFLKKNPGPDDKCIVCCSFFCSENHPIKIVRRSILWQHPRNSRDFLVVYLRRKCWAITFFSYSVLQKPEPKSRAQARFTSRVALRSSCLAKSILDKMVRIQIIVNMQSFIGFTSKDSSIQHWKTGDPGNPSIDISLGPGHWWQSLVLL